MRTESFEKFLGPIGYDEPMAKKTPEPESKPAATETVKREQLANALEAVDNDLRYSFDDAIAQLKPLVETHGQLRHNIKALGIVTYEAAGGNVRKKRFLDAKQIAMIRDRLTPKKPTIPR